MVQHLYCSVSTYSLFSHILNLILLGNTSNSSNSIYSSSVTTHVYI